MCSNNNKRFIDDFRPLCFRDFDGIDDKIKLIHKYKLREHDCHFLLCGPNGSGKSSLAETIERYIHCEQPDGLEPCLKCDSCKQSFVFGYVWYKTRTHYGYELNDIDYIQLMDSLRGVPLFSERTWHLVIEDLDYANKKALNGLIPFLDATQNTTLIFTATDMSIIPNAVKSRCIIINLSKYSVDSLLCLAMRIIRNKKLVVNDESFLPRLIEITNYNPRSIVNALEAVWLKGRCIDDTLLRDQDYISNLGLTVGEERDNPL